MADSSEICTDSLVPRELSEAASYSADKQPLQEVQPLLKQVLEDQEDRALKFNVQVEVEACDDKCLMIIDEDENTGNKTIEISNGNKKNIDDANLGDNPLNTFAIAKQCVTKCNINDATTNKSTEIRSNTIFHEKDADILIVTPAALYGLCKNYKMSNPDLTIKREVMSCVIDRKTLKRKIDRLSETFTSQADKILTMEVRNLLGKKLDGPTYTYHDELVLKAVQAWRNWCTQSKLRDSIVAYKCYICLMAWWHLGQFQEHIKIHREAKVELEKVMRECYLICYHTNKEKKDIPIDENCWRCLKSYEPHMHRNRSSQQYRCIGCSDIFYPCLSLFEHEGVCQRFHKILFKDIVRYESDWKCQICNINCLTKTRYDAHLVGLHSVRSDLPMLSFLMKRCIHCNEFYYLYFAHVCWNRPCNFKCPACFRSFQSKWYQQLHTLVNFSMTSCRICGDVLKARCLETEHMLEHTDNFVTAYVCMYCEDYVMYLDKKSLQLHIDCSEGHLKRKLSWKKNKILTEVMIVPKSLFSKSRSMLQSIKNIGKLSGVDQKQWQGHKPQIDDPSQKSNETCNSEIVTECSEKKVPALIPLPKKPISNSDAKKKKKDYAINLDSNDSDSDNVEIIESDDVIHIITDDEDEQKVENKDNRTTLKKKNEILQKLKNVYKTLTVGPADEPSADDRNVKESENNAANIEAKEKVAETEEETQMETEEDDNATNTEIKPLSNVFRPSKSVIKKDHNYINLNHCEVVDETDKQLKYEQMLSKVFQTSANIPNEIANEDISDEDFYEDDIITWNSNFITDSNFDGINIENSGEPNLVRDENVAINLVPHEEVVMNLVPDVMVAMNLVPDENVKINVAPGEKVAITMVPDQKVTVNLVQKEMNSTSNSDEIVTSNVVSDEIVTKIKQEQNLNVTLKIEDNEERQEPEKSDLESRNADTDIDPNETVNFSQIKIKEEPKEKELDSNIDEPYMFLKTELTVDEMDYTEETAAFDSCDIDTVKVEPEVVLQITNALEGAKQKTLEPLKSLVRKEKKSKEKINKSYYKSIEIRNPRSLLRKNVCKNILQLVKSEPDTLGIQEPNTTNNGVRKCKTVRKIVCRKEIVYVESNKKKKYYQCNKCNFVGLFNAMMKHKKLCPNRKQKLIKTNLWSEYKCTKCNCTFKKLADYINHLSIHNIDYCSCPQCPKKYYYASNRLAHILNHIKQFFKRVQSIISGSGRFNYNCKVCDRQRIAFSNLFKHWEEHLVLDRHAVVNTPKEKIPEVDHHLTLAEDVVQTLTDLLQLTDADARIGTGREYKKIIKNCPLCERDFDRKSDCKRHLIEHLLTDARACKLQNGGLLCRICKTICSMTPEYRSHMRDHAHLPVFQCDLCNKSFSDSSNFAKHKKVHNLAILICDTCDKKFHSKVQLIKHIELHTSMGQINCPYCDRINYSMSAHKKHLKLHERRLSFTCQICRQKFDNLKGRWEHLWQKHGERKVIADCLVCDKKFRTRQQVKLHMKKDHNLNVSFSNLVGKPRGEGYTVEHINEPSSSKIHSDCF